MAREPVWAVYALFSSSKHVPDHDHNDDALRILAERLAKGEIDTEEARPPT